MDGRITVYWRGRWEHLGIGQEGGTFDFGHTLMSVEDYRSGEIVYLDGWRLQDGSFYWNLTPDPARLSDHHNISWEVDSDTVEPASLLIKGITNSSTPYEVRDYNCTSAVAEVLSKVGLSIEVKNLAGYGYDDPALIGARLMRALKRQGIPFNHDVCPSPLTYEEAVTRLTQAYHKCKNDCTRQELVHLRTIPGVNVTSTELPGGFLMVGGSCSSDSSPASVAAFEAAVSETRECMRLCDEWWQTTLEKLNRKFGLTSTVPPS